MLYIYTNETHWFNHQFNYLTGLISPRMQIVKKLFCSHFSVNKGLIQHVVQSCYNHGMVWYIYFFNYNITFRKLEIHTVKMIPISACYTSGRGARHFLGIGRCTIGACVCLASPSRCGTWTITAVNKWQNYNYFECGYIRRWWKNWYCDKKTRT